MGHDGCANIDGVPFPCTRGHGSSATMVDAPQKMLQLLCLLLPAMLKARILCSHYGICQHGMLWLHIHLPDREHLARAVKAQLVGPVHASEHLISTGQQGPKKLPLRVAETRSAAVAPRCV